MRRIIAQTMVSLDGCFEGPAREIDWHLVDDEYTHYAANLLASVDGILFGRLTYELMFSYWPTAYAQEKDPAVAGWMNSLHKTVFSRTLTNVAWDNTTLVRTDMIETIKARKQESGRPLVILGSGMLVKELTKHRLIDEYQLMVNPVLLGSGNRLFDEQSGRLQLKLVESRAFASGNILLRYQLADDGS